MRGGGVWVVVAALAVALPAAGSAVPRVEPTPRHATVALQVPSTRTISAGEVELVPTHRSVKLR